MKKRLIPYIVIMTLVLALCVGNGGTVLADDAITTSVQVSPASLPAAGTAHVTVTIKNNGDPISDVVLKYPSPTDTEISIGNMATGDTQTHDNPAWNITDAMFNTSMAFTVSWTSSDGTRKSGNTQAISIEKKDAVVKVTGTASASATEVNAGDKVKFTFSMKNEGTVKVDNAYLNAPPIDQGAQIGSNFSLDAGAVHNMDYNVTVNQNMEVKPVFTYAVNGQEQKLTLDTISIKVKETAQTVAMSLTIDVDKAQVNSGDKVNFSVTVRNTGSSQLDGITVKDFDGNTVNMPTSSLSAGSSTAGSVAIPISTTGNYAFTATAVGAGGESVNQQSNAIAITLDGDAEPSPSASGAVNPNDAMRTDIKLSSDSLDAPGEVTMEVEVTNLTGDVLTELVVRDDTIGTIGTAASVEAGETKTFEKTFHVEETTQFIFKTSAKLADGTDVETQIPAQIVVRGTDAGMPAWQVGLIVVIIAIAGVGVALALYIRNQKKKGATRGKPTRQRPEAYRQRDREYSASGRERPQRYQGQGQEEYGRPERPASARQESYQQRRRMQVETLEPKPKAPPEQPGPKGGGSGSGGSNVKFGDRNKF